MDVNLAPARPTLGNRIAPPRILLFAAILIAGLAAFTLAGGRDWLDGAVIAFDFAAAVFVASLMPLLRYADPDAMRAHAAQNDANRRAILVLTSALTLVLLASIGGELPDARHGDAGAVAKLIATLLLIWLFANSVYALHYAHAFYTEDPATRQDRAGLGFPGTTSPTYWDFAYFAFTLGMAFQTSDVAVLSTRLRRIVLLHSFGAFIFNIGVIAFAINALGGAV